MCCSSFTLKAAESTLQALQGIPIKSGCSRWLLAQRKMVGDHLNGCRYVLRDRDSKFCDSFRSALRSAGLKIFQLPPQSPDGRSILGSGGTQARPGLYIFDPRTGAATELAPLESGSGIGDTAWAPDGKTVFYHAMNTVYAKNLSTGETKEICLSPGDSVIRSFAVSRDGGEVACVSMWSLVVVPAAGGVPRELLRLHDTYDHFQFNGGVAWTPDSSQIVFPRGDPGVRRTPVVLRTRRSPWST